MKKHSKINTTLAATLAVLLSSPAWAMNMQALTDTNGDGIISAEEIKQARETARAAAVIEFDTDGNGELSRSERKAMKKARKAEMVAQFDTDGNGKLSRAEKKAAREARRANIESNLDVNQDGEVSDAERAGFEEVREERGHKHGKGFGKHRGLNSDGKQEDGKNKRSHRNNN